MAHAHVITASPGCVIIKVTVDVTETVTETVTMDVITTVTKGVNAGKVIDYLHVGRTIKRACLIKPVVSIYFIR